MEKESYLCQCKSCFGKGWNDVFREICGHYSGGEVFKQDCEECNATGLINGDVKKHILETR